MANGLSKQARRPLALRHGDEWPIRLTGVHVLWETCTHETETRLPLPSIPHRRASRCAGAHVWLRTVCLQLGRTPAHGCLVWAPGTHELYRPLGGAYAPETAGGDGLACRGVECGLATGVAAFGKRVSPLLRGTCQVPHLQAEAWQAIRHLCQYGLFLGWRHAHAQTGEDGHPAEDRLVTFLYWHAHYDHGLL